ncbi:hypothetical protein [Streptomyces sp. NPDC049915]|uniref:hypothetical protein n=1 Tax=Streptomyces sp. NPDC049915 TaxID=3155510 RepID=UPI00342CD8E9
MYGHGAAPPSRSAGTVITLRVLFAAAGFLSCGLLACLPLFRIAFVRGRRLDWAAAWVSLPLSITAFAVVGSVPEGDSRGDVALALVLILGAVATAYFLVVDIQLDRARRLRATGYAHAQAPTVHGSYGYPQPGPAYPPPGPVPPVAPVHPTPIPQPLATPTPPPPHRPAPARIDQVRAELDELSDYLRRGDGHEGHGEGGR